MTLKNVEAIYENIDEVGEIVGHYTREVFFQVLMIPVDRSLHNVFHTVIDYKEEMLEALER